MSYVISNLNVPYRGHDFSAEEVSAMNAEQFDRLTIEEQTFIYNTYPSEYDRLNGNSADNTEATTDATTDTRTDEQRFYDEFEERLDRALHNAFHANEP